MVWNRAFHYQRHGQKIIIDLVSNTLLLLTERYISLEPPQSKNSVKGSSWWKQATSGISSIRWITIKVRQRNAFQPNANMRRELLLRREEWMRDSSILSFEEITQLLVLFHVLFWREMHKAMWHQNVPLTNHENTRPLVYKTWNPSLFYTVGVNLEVLEKVLAFLISKQIAEVGFLMSLRLIHPKFQVHTSQSFNKTENRIPNKCCKWKCMRTSGMPDHRFEFWEMKGLQFTWNDFVNILKPGLYFWFI